MGWSQLWLNYQTYQGVERNPFFESIVCRKNSSILKRAQEELVRFSEQAFGITPKLIEESKEGLSGIEFRHLAKNLLGDEGFHLVAEDKRVVIESSGEKGILYGVFALIRAVMEGRDLEKIDETEIPDCKYRMLDHWDNADGSIERGYSGKSFFFSDGKILVHDRIVDYARLAASIGINQVAINNVNVKGKAPFFITGEYLFEIKKIADIFGSYGIRLYLSVDFSAPLSVGNLDTADPLKTQVKNWWKECVSHLYQIIPEFGGFLVKADSEGRPGPFYYGRNHADGANMLAEALQPYGGMVIWRCFVYNCRQDWRDSSADRAKAAYDTFLPMDGKFHKNVILQIKNGPMDFQVREPVSPLFGGLTKTNQMLELQIAQEYTGHQIDICYLVPMWKQILAFKTFCKENDDQVSDIICGKTFENAECGMAGVSNTGNDENWTGHDLAAANWYGFGRLAWNHNLDAEKIAEEWCVCTFGKNHEVLESICRILMKSWPAYEKYTSPYGIGWMVTPHTHYGPSIEGYEFDVWGTYHKANCKAIGIDRSSRGTGYTQQYREPNAAMYDQIEDCPEELLLFFHRVPYDYVMKNGNTLLQNIYNLHFEGVEEVKEIMDIWQNMKKLLPEELYNRVWERMEQQYENSRNWRDVVNTYFYRMTLIGDQLGRKIYE